ncbi:MAG: hypothetical protein FWF46_01130 [Oscillospiraceae bacterium]|nr:hypothetical protein [Oscillospiraceae bacterium]
MDVETRQAYSEVNRFLELIGEELSSKIPLKLRNFFKREMDNSYIPTLNADTPIKEQTLKRKTLAIIAGLNLQYWVKDEEKKKELTEIYTQNNINYQNEIKEKYNPDNLFKNRERPSIIEKTEEDAMVVHEELSLFKRIVNKIKNIFAIK